MGVHSPEFFWERNHERAAATCKFSILYPVVLDNDLRDLGALRRFGGRPRSSSIAGASYDTEHVGEGAYATTEALLRRLLDEPA